MLTDGALTDILAQHGLTERYGRLWGVALVDALCSRIVELEGQQRSDVQLDAEDAPGVLPLGELVKNPPQAPDSGVRIMTIEELQAFAEQQAQKHFGMTAAEVWDAIAVEDPEICTKLASVQLRGLWQLISAAQS